MDDLSWKIPSKNGWWLGLPRARKERITWIVVSVGDIPRWRWFFPDIDQFLLLFHLSSILDVTKKNDLWQYPGKPLFLRDCDMLYHQLAHRQQAWTSFHSVHKLHRGAPPATFPARAFWTRQLRSPDLGLSWTFNPFVTPICDLLWLFLFFHDLLRHFCWINCNPPEYWPLLVFGSV